MVSLVRTVVSRTVLNVNPVAATLRFNFQVLYYDGWVNLMMHEVPLSLL